MTRIFRRLAVVVVFCALTARAQSTYQWTNLVSGVADGSWSNGASWNPTGPAAGADNTAQFTQPVTGTALLTLDGSYTIGNLFFGNTATNPIGWTINVGTPLTSVLTLSVSGGASLVTVTNQSATLGAVLAGTQGFTKTGSGVLNLNGANTYTGLTTVSAGSVTLNNLNAITNGNSVNVANGAVLQPKQAGTFANVTTTLNGSGTAGGSFGGALDFHSGGNTTVTWPGRLILNAANATIGSYGVTYNVTLSGQLTGGGSLNIRPEGGSPASHSATYTLSNPSNNYAGSTTMQVGTAQAFGTLKLGVNNGLPVTTALNLDRVGSSGVVYFDLAGFSQTVAGLTADFSSNAVMNSSGTVATLTVSNSADTAFKGVIGTSGKAGINFLKQGNAMLTVSGTNLFTGSTTIAAGKLALNGLITATSSLLMSSNATLHIGLAAPGGPTNIVANGNVTLAGQINVSDRGFTANTSYPVIYYTGNLTNNGITVAPLASCEFTIDTSVPHVVSLVVGQKFPLVQLSNTNFAVSTLTTNLSGILRGSPAGPIWYEVRDQTNKMWDFGATLAVTPWNITVRHLREGTNTVTIFAQDGAGNIQSNSIQLTLTLGPNSGVRPRPIPSEVWWGGLSDNYQMTNYSQWPFVQKYEDGYFFHSAGWGGSTAGLQQSLATNLFPSNTKYWTELGGNTPNPNTNSGFNQATVQGDSAQVRENNGIIYTEFTHDYHMENMQPVCQVNPTWPTNDQIAWWTGDLTVADGSYPYASGIWRDAFNGYYAQFPHIKVGHTSQPEYWPWGSYPAEVVNQISFTVTNPTTAFSFNARDIIGSFVNMARDIGHPYFSLQSDAPWDYFGGLRVGTAAEEATMRQKIRIYEQYLQSRNCRHTLICNVSNAGTNSQGVPYGGSWATANAYYESSSLSSMMLHQQEGGRANRYLYESWYWGVPSVVVPETQTGSYTHLALTAIKYLKGIADTNGNLEQLKLGVISTGATNKLSITNNGDVACLPAITVSESGSSYLVARYFNAAGQDVTAAMLNGEGYCHTNLLQPGQSTTITVVVNGLVGASLDSTRSITFEAYWNPQDPTGVVRDRTTISVTASNLVSNADTDGDGMNDANELALGRNPFNAGDLGFEFNTDGNFDGWGSFNNITNTAVSGGSITGTSSTVDPYFSRSGFNFAGNSVSNLMVRIRTTAAGTVQLFWGRVGSPNFTGSMRVDVAYAPANTWQLIVFPLATNADWKNQTITSLRLDPISVAGQPFEIDWLRATDGNLSAPVLAPITNRTLIAGQSLTLTNAATDADLPLTFSLLNPPAGAAINASNGVFTWRPAIAQSPSTNLVSVKVVDNGSPVMSATQSFSVFVLRPVSPTISGVTISNGGFGLTVSGDAGPDYALFASTNLMNWSLLQQTNSASLPFRFADPAWTNFNRRFYRIQLLP